MFCREGYSRIPCSVLQAKILPLRLHVDQDALDFLKRFFSFKDPKAASAQADEHAGGKEEVYLRALRYLVMLACESN